MDAEAAVASSSTSDSIDCQATGKLAFEGCPFYLHEHAAADMLYAVFPKLRALAILRNPRERSVSAFNDYVRVGRIGKGTGAQQGRRMEELVEYLVAQIHSGARTMENYDMRLLTSGVYIHGLRKWGQVFPSSQLMLVQSEALFENPAAEMQRVYDFLGLQAGIVDVRMFVTFNKNPMSSKAKPSRRINQTLDEFFAPYNEELYEWCSARGMPFSRWPNATNA